MIKLLFARKYLRKRALFGSAVAAALIITAAPASAEDSAGNTCNAASINSPPGIEWMESYGWRYPDDVAAEAAYGELVTGQSPWPSWFTPALSWLPQGTLFQMALGTGQPTDRPGGFGTFDNILNVAEIREYLAVLQVWKPDIDRVATYRTTQQMVAMIGPIGPQVDAETCELLPGRYSQFQMVVPPQDRMNYLELVGVRAIPATVDDTD